MAESETPMTSRKEVRQRNRGLYWLVALIALAVIGVALLGYTDDRVDENRSVLDEGAVAPLIDGIEVGGSGGGGN
ncbi:hypothetical protein [Phaeobacter sp. B1627]|uniref:hypothetical protein n=1 Tax=Phaeobacter sp. B1627 TaxID=2583809 RepID=UPI00111AD007|nr:hypothetical protein [Phaeobacter sp. B1627]TNJ42681.1 hypothetical protein FGE21_10275 [Phaeobacter sp. B1627]